MKSCANDDGWRVPDELWREMKQFLPARKKHPLGCHNPRVADRTAMDGILLVLRTGCKWTTLDASGICSHSSAHRRFREWKTAGIFEQFRKHGLLNDEKLQAVDWSWLADEKNK